MSYYKYWIIDAEENLERLIREKWQQIIENQRFALNSPNVNVPLIDRACINSEKKGIKKVANIILAAQYSVDLKLEKTMLDELQKLSN